MEIGGINANQIVTDLMALERRPLDLLEQRQSLAQTAATALAGLRTSVDSFRFASVRLADATSFSRYSASSSNSAAVSVSTSSDAVPSALTFSVTQVAANHGLRSVGTVSTADSNITSAGTISIATGGAAHGIGMVRSGAGLAAGDHDITVTQASTGAVKVGNAALTSQTFGTGLLGGDPEFIDVSVDGVATSIEFVAGSYTATQIADTISQGLIDDGVAATASLDADGRLTVATTSEGSAHSIQFTGGPLAKLQMTADASALTGGDAVVDINGTTTTLTSLTPGGTVTLDTGDGDLEVDLTGGLRLGSIDVTTVDVGGGSLAEVAAAINNSNSGASAAAIRVNEGEWRLQINARTAGEDGELLVDDSVLAAIGGLVESSAAQNAQIEIGDGIGAYTVNSSTNTFSDVLAGTSLTVAAVTTDPVTVSVTRDNSGLAADVQSLVTAANTALTQIGVQTRYGVEGTGNGALAGNSAMRQVADGIRSALGRPVDGVTGMIGADVGIQTARDGTFTFDQATFIAAMEEDPASVARYFGRDATPPVGATFNDAAAITVTGSYDIEVTTAATQATSALAFDGGSASATRVGVQVGDTVVNIDIAAGRTAAQIVDSLNEVIGDAGLSVVAEVSAGGLVLRSTQWGEGGSFDLNLDVNGVGTWDDVDGVNVAGTIDGIAATGIGRTLSLNELVDSNAAGLSVDIDGGVSGVLGALEYQPGLAARVAEITTQMLSDEGTFESADSAQERRIEDFNDQIERFEDRLFTRETNLRRQWSSLQTLLEGLQQQSGWLSSQIAGLPTNSN